MQDNSSGADGGAAAGDGGLATPNRELQRIRQEAGERDQELRCALKQATLEASGEVGYRRLTVQKVLDRSGGSRARFYRHFTSKEDCYTAAYEVAVERLAERVLEAGAAANSWPRGLQTALGTLARFAEEQPHLARGILAEVHVAGEPAMAKRKEVTERLSRAIDSARRQEDREGSKGSPPRITADFMLGAIEEALVGALVRDAPEEFAAAVPSLTYLAVTIYFGDQFARDSLGTASN